MLVLFSELSKPACKYNARIIQDVVRKPILILTKREV